MLSVVTYTYNDHGFALETLRRLERHQAVVGQVVVVDDGSAEPFAAPRGPLSGRLTVARHPANQGPGLAKRTGLALASGPLILSVDSDIEWDALWFYSALERVREPDVGIVGAPIVEKNHGDSLSAALHFASLARLGQARDAGFARGGIWLTRKDVLDAVGGLGDYGRATHEDWHLCRKVRERGLRVVVNDRGTVLQTRRIGRSQCVRRDALYLADGYAGLIAREEPAALLSVLTWRRPWPWRKRAIARFWSTSRSPPAPRCSPAGRAGSAGTASRRPWPRPSRPIRRSCARSWRIAACPCQRPGRNRGRWRKSSATWPKSWARRACAGSTTPSCPKPWPRKRPGGATSISWIDQPTKPPSPLPQAVPLRRDAGR